MAQHQLDYVVGNDETNIAIAGGSSISTNAIRVTIDDGNITSKRQVLDALDIIKRKIFEATWPLA